MDGREYLLSYGNVGDFGRFGAAEPMDCRRGDRLVVQSHRGLELGSVMRRASPGHAHLLAGQFLGTILRRATAEDDRNADRQLERSQMLFTRSRRLAADRQLPMEILDAEILLDGRQAILHYLGWEECDPRPLMDELGDEFRLLVTLHDLALPIMGAVDEETGCGAPGCGSGACSSCKTGNCSSCGVARRLQASGGRQAGSHAQTVPADELGISSALLAPGEDPRGRLSLL